MPSRKLDCVTPTHGAEDRNVLNSSNNPTHVGEDCRVRFFRFHKAASVIESCSHKSWLSTFCSHNSRLSIAHRGFGSVTLTPTSLSHPVVFRRLPNSAGAVQTLCTVSKASIRTTVTIQSCSTGPKHRYNTKIWDLLQDVTFFKIGCCWGAQF